MVQLVNLLAGLGEFKIRDLNDEINKLLKEKGLWEDQIKDLGGPDYKVIKNCHVFWFASYIKFFLKKVGPKLLDKEGKEAPGNRGYKY